jgi:hypothetical protein
MVLVSEPVLGPRARLSLGSMSLIMLAWGCKPGTTPPDFSTPYDSVGSDTLLAYIEDTTKLKFDPVPGVGDEQRLMLGTCPGACSHGPRVKIEPEKRSYRNKLSSLSGQGRIIARMINYDTTEYPKFNLGGHDTAYWAVTQADSTMDPDSLRSTSLFISIRGLRGTRTPVITYDTGYVEKHGYGYYGEHALARWIWSDADETSWGSCAKGACCR